MIGQAEVFGVFVIEAREVSEEFFAQRAQAYGGAVLEGSAGVGFAGEDAMGDGCDFGGGESGFIDEARGEID